MPDQPPTVIPNPPIDQWRYLDGYYVHRYEIISTDMVCYTAWEPLRGGLLNASHSTMTSHESAEGSRIWLGEVGTERIPDYIARMPGASRERIDACGRWWDANGMRARAAIVELFPEAAAADGAGRHDLYLIVPGARDQARYENRLAIAG